MSLVTLGSCLRRNTKGRGSRKKSAGLVRRKRDRSALRHDREEPPLPLRGPAPGAVRDLGGDVVAEGIGGGSGIGGWGGHGRAPWLVKSQGRLDWMGLKDIRGTYVASGGPERDIG